MNLSSLHTYIPKDDLYKWRQSQFTTFEKLGLPTRKDEAWKYTDLSALNTIAFSVNETETMSDQLHRIENTVRLVFINGVFSTQLSDTVFEKGLVVKPILESDIETSIQDENTWTALNNALFSQGFFINVEENAVITKPLHLLHVQTNTPHAQIQNIKHRIHVNAFSQLTLFEEYCGNSHQEYFNNIVLDIHVGHNAMLSYYRLQQESPNAFHIAHTQITQKSDSMVHAYHVDRGAKISRHTLQNNLEEKNASSQFVGLYTPSAKQHMDSHIDVNHLAPHCRSEQFYRGVIDGDGHAVFNGRIYVHQKAQKTDAYLNNQNLLLHPKAQVDTKPELEIYADDVKCAHGATVGQIDNDALFYLQSRGIEKKQAEKLLINAFLTALFEKMPKGMIRDYLTGDQHEL